MSVRKDLGMVTAYAYAVSKGYAGTEEQFAALMASYADVGQTAVDAAQTATTAAQTATTKAGEATTAATTATGKASEAAQNATQAAGSATTAGASATAAQTAQTAAETAQGKAEDAQAAAEAAAQTLVIDPTLTQANQAAEAKATGDAISLVKSQLEAIQIVDTASGAIATFPDGSDGIPVESLTVSMEPIQEGSGDPSPENIRPISGRQSVTVTRAGKNLIDPTEFFDATKWATGSNASYKWYSIKCVPGAIVSVSFNVLRTSSFAVQLSNAIDVSGTTIYAANAVVGRYSGTITATGNTVYLRAYKNDVTADFFADVQAAYESTPSSYEPFNGQSVTIPLGQTVYGGTVDVVSGVMTVDMVYEDIKANADSYTQKSTDVSGQYFYSRRNTATNTINAYASKQLFTSGIVYNPYIYSQDRGNTTAQVLYSAIGADIRVGSFGYDTLSDWIAFAKSQDAFGIVYPLETPLTVQFVGQSMTTLKGTNNIWSDGGDVAVDYVADTKLFIEQLTEPDADMVADANITSGKYFMVGNQLYLATANIASGATISPGVNCTRTNLAAALNAINS